MKTTILRKWATGLAARFHEKHGVWGSYDSETMLFHSSIGLPDGRSVQCFVNRNTGLIVIDVIDKGGKGGCEIMRRTA